MRTVATIAWREARSLAASSVAQVAAALTLAVSGLLFVSELSNLTQARLDGWFQRRDNFTTAAQNFTPNALLDGTTLAAASTRESNLRLLHVDQLRRELDRLGLGW